MNHPINKIRFARTLRKRQTNAERFLWQKLRARQLAGVKFRRQEPIDPYIVDFVSIENKLIIELDGSQHSKDKIRYNDLQRTKVLEAKGYNVLRFWDNEVLINIEGVLAKITLTLTLSQQERED